MPRNPSEDHPGARRPASAATQFAFGLALVVQVLTLPVDLFSDIGFDKPGRSGLVFGHYLILVGIWFGASCLGLVHRMDVPAS